jgi:hypothetical protein
VAGYASTRQSVSVAPVDGFVVAPTSVGRDSRAPSSGVVISTTGKSFSVHVTGVTVTNVSVRVAVPKVLSLAHAWTSTTSPASGHV